MLNHSEEIMNIKQYMEIVDYRITEGDHFTWTCFGDKAYNLSAWNGDYDGWSTNMVFDTGDQTVYIVEVCDYKNKRAYRYFNPEFKQQYMDYSKTHNPDYRDQAWDDVDFTDLEVEEDWLNKTAAIIAGENYDTRVSVPVDFTDEELLKYMKMAHERDMTFNQFVEEAIKQAIKDHEQDPEGFKLRAQTFVKQESEPHGY